MRTMTTYKTPGVYVEEISTLPPSVAEVSTAIPAFLGYTAQVPGIKIARITSLLEFTTVFGDPLKQAFVAELKPNPVTNSSKPQPPRELVKVKRQLNNSPYPDWLLSYALSHYFMNGGGPCYVVSVGQLGTATERKIGYLTAGLHRHTLEDEPTLIVLTDAVLLPNDDYFKLAEQALSQCENRKDRFVILDVPMATPSTPSTANTGLESERIAAFRKKITNDYLRYAAVYYPDLVTTLTYDYDEKQVYVGAAPTYKGKLELPVEARPTDALSFSFTGFTQEVPRVEFVFIEPLEFVDFVVAGVSPVVTAGGQPVLTIKIAGNNKTTQDIATAWAKWTGDNTKKQQGFHITFVSNVTLPSKLSPVVLKLDNEAQTQTLTTLYGIRSVESGLYNQIKEAISRLPVTLPPSAALAGVYARVDRDRGVWKAPANVSLFSVVRAVRKISDADQDILNIDSIAGKSINAIRDFPGRGTLVWGARTLAGNDNEWRYVSVRRLFITIEENVRKASAFAVFEPNDATTWLKVRGMIGDYLYSMWERGALAGSKPEAAYYVHIGLGTTMTQQDILEGRMIVEIGVAAVRPAEFIVLQFIHKLQEA